MSKYLSDLTERVATGFVTGALAAIPVGTVIDDWSALEQAGISAASGGVVAVLHLILGMLARRTGDPDTASLRKRG